MVSTVAIVDDKRRVQEVLLSATPGTPIADFLDEHEEELRRRMEETQVLLTAATADMSSANLTMEEKFSKVWEKFKVEKKSIETLEKEIEEVRSAARDNEKEEGGAKAKNPSLPPHSGRGSRLLSGAHLLHPKKYPQGQEDRIQEFLATLFLGDTFIFKKELF